MTYSETKLKICENYSHNGQKKFFKVIVLSAWILYVCHSESDIRLCISMETTTGIKNK